MLQSVDLNKHLGRGEYKRRLPELQLQLRQLAYQLYVRRLPLVVVYEGWDAGGKGGNIRRVTATLDPRGYHVYPIGAPQGEDASHHFLWRFWRRLRSPDDKQILIFDRSWYGRVLVERVENLAGTQAWRRAYREINEFERQLADADFTIVKFWLHISRNEQLRRFQKREQTPHKKWKLTEEDWRNRQKWDLYEQAAKEMLIKTSTLTAPWTVVEANDKLYARIKTLETLVGVLTERLEDRKDSSQGK